MRWSQRLLRLSLPLLLGSTLLMHPLTGNAMQTRVDGAPPQAPKRLLILTPHPDDESLVAAAMIERTKRAGGAVQLVVMTNGDGFRRAAVQMFHHDPPTAEDLLHLGRVRQEELKQATRELGLQPQEVTLLGYPDAGLGKLWSRHWAPEDEPYRGYNGATAVPYATAYRPQAPYLGQEVLHDLQALLHTFQPTDVLYPDPRDIHQDHWAAGVFLQAALLSQRSGTAEPQEWTYLVHYPGFPKPKAFLPQRPLEPPKFLTQTDLRWHALPLSDALRRRKHDAIRSHRSQNLMMRDFLESFVRSNELISSTRVPLIAPAEAGTAPEATFTDPTDDRSYRAQEGAPDLLAVTFTKRAQRLHLQLDFAKPLPSRWRMRLRCHFPNAPDHPDGQRLSFLADEQGLQLPAASAISRTAPQYERDRKRLVFSMPAEVFPAVRQLLAQVVIYDTDKVADRSMWMRVRLRP